jgi:hypothetical protein
MLFRLYYFWLTTLLIVACSWKINYTKCDTPKFETIEKDINKTYTQGDANLNFKKDKLTTIQTGITNAKINAIQNLLPKLDDQKIEQEVNKFKQERIFLNKCDEIFIYLSIDKNEYNKILKENNLTKD